MGLPERDGLLVRDVAAGSPAEAAGLRRGDLIVGAGGTAVADTDDLAAVLDALEGDSVTLSIVRGVEETTVEVRFTTGDEPAPSTSPPSRRRLVRLGRRKTRRCDKFSSGAKLCGEKDFVPPNLDRRSHGASD